MTFSKTMRLAASLWIYFFVTPKTCVNEIHSNVGKCDKGTCICPSASNSGGGGGDGGRDFRAGADCSIQVFTSVHTKYGLGMLSSQGMPPLAKMPFPIFELFPLLLLPWQLSSSTAASSSHDVNLLPPSLLSLAPFKSSKGFKDKAVTRTRDHAADGVDGVDDEPQGHQDGGFVYIYDLPPGLTAWRDPIVPERCSDLLIFEALYRSRYRTLDPGKAALVVLPVPTIAAQQG